MLGRTLNLGILAHVDAGKTTLTERLLYRAGVIRELGSVDRGTTQTDSLELERRRGITIKSAVVSFSLDDTTVNLIDTPGHPDFIAEVERVLAVLDGAVLVLSAVEGVQPQTLVLFRALHRLGIPTLFFVNKTDRAGADVERVVGAISERLTHGPPVLPVVSGSAITGAGIEDLIAAITQSLPPAAGDVQSPAVGTVFKIDRAPNGEKVAYVRMFDGTLRVRERVHADEKATAIGVFENGRVAARPSVSAGQIATVRGLRSIQIGDHVGAGAVRFVRPQFAPPTLETVVVAADGARLKLALGQLAEQDPLIGVRQDANGDLSVSIYGEVQKQVIEATLAADFGLDVTFRETTPIYIERPSCRGEAVETLHAPSNPYLATIGLRVEPAPEDSGVEFRLAVTHDDVPLYAYKRMELFAEHMAEYVREALREGPNGWEVTDCVVTMVESAYSVPDGPPSRRGPLSKPIDFRKLTPIVVRRALERARTVVCEPMLDVRIEVPVATLGATLAAVSRLGGDVAQPDVGARVATVSALLPAARTHDLQLELPGLASGEGVLESTFGGYRPVSDRQ